MSDAQDKIIDELLDRLGHLAAEWRGLHSRQKYEEAAMKVEEYHSVISQLWALGWDGTDLLPDSELPDKLMPKDFVERWRKKK